jgi:hypothetical protein
MFMLLILGNGFMLTRMGIPLVSRDTTSFRVSWESFFNYFLAIPLVDHVMLAH